MLSGFRIKCLYFVEEKPCLPSSDNWSDLVRTIEPGLIRNTTLSPKLNVLLIFNCFGGTSSQNFSIPQLPKLSKKYWIMKNSSLHISGCWYLFYGTSFRERKTKVSICMTRKLYFFYCDQSLSVPDFIYPFSEGRLHVWGRRQNYGERFGLCI